MRKFSKIVLGTAAVLGIAGIGCSIAGAAMGASFSEVDLQQYYGRDHDSFLDRWLDWEWDEEDSEESSQYKSRTALQSSESGAETDTYMAEIPAEMDIKLTYDELILKAYDGDQIRVEVTGDEDGNVRINSDENELKIESRKKAEHRRIVVSCPENTEFQKVSVDVGAGAVSVENNLITEEFEISVGAGAFSNAASVTAANVEAEVGTGALTLEGLDAEKIDAECGLGIIKLEVKGKEKDYSYHLSCGAGTVNLGEQEYSGVGAQNKIENPDASRRMKIQCGMGTVNIGFEGGIA